jgi:hypothetical protein
MLNSSPRVYKAVSAGDVLSHLSSPAIVNITGDENNYPGAHLQSVGLDVYFWQCEELHQHILNLNPLFPQRADVPR